MTGMIEANSDASRGASPRLANDIGHIRNLEEQTRKTILSDILGKLNTRIRIENKPIMKTKFTMELIDCVQGMKMLAEGSVDLVVTSPPYNLGIKYRNYQDNKSQKEYLSWSCEWAAEVKRVLAENGSFFLNLGACPSNPLIPHELIVALKETTGFVLQNTFHWIKSITIETKEGQQVSAGHFKPLQSKRFVNDCHEYNFHLTKNGDTELNRLGLGVAYADKSNIRRWGHTKGRDLRCRGNNWFIPYKTILSRAKDRPHPATFPVALAANCIKIHGARPGLVMLDPFVGIGHAAVAAKECGIGHFIGFDIDAEYLEVARRAVSDNLVQRAFELKQRPKKDKTPPENERMLL
jgi:site-specific DNA-methyltransferase (adenine-specific)